jgi:hypothetical protein
MSAFGGKADIAAKLLTRHEAWRIAASDDHRGEKKALELVAHSEGGKHRGQGGNNRKCDD